MYLRYFDPKTGNGGAYLGYVGPTFLLSGAGWVFLHPEGYTGDFQAFFDLPDGWTVAVPWNKVGSGYVWTIGSDPLAFARSVVGLGAFQKSVLSIGGSNLTVAVHTSFSTTDSERILEFASRGFQYVASLFGATPPTSYVSVWVPKPNNNRIDFIETYNGAGEAIDGFGMNMMYSFLHRFIHTFNAFEPTGMRMRSDSERWFSEGCNVYYDSKIPYVLGYQKDLNWLIDYFREYRGYYGSSYDAPVTTTEPFSDRILSIVYVKASLVCFMLDSVILRTTNGTRSLSDLLRRMYERYGNFRGYYSTDDIQRMASQISGFDLTKFFKIYVWGSSKLPVILSASLGITVDWDPMAADLGPIPGQLVMISQHTTYALTGVTTIEAAQTATSTPLTQDPQTVALEAIRRADTAIQMAKFEGRTLGLDQAIQFLAQARDAYSLSDYPQSLLLAQQANLAAGAAKYPFAVTRGINPTSQTSFLSLNYSIPLVAALILLTATLLTIKYRRKKSSG